MISGQISKALEKRKWTRAGAILASLGLVFFMVQLLVLDNPKNSRAEPAAFAFDNTQLLVSPNDILYIGKSGLQTERIWTENTPFSGWDDPIGRSGITINGSTAATEIAKYRINSNPNIPATDPDYPTDRIYDSAYIMNMNFPLTPGDARGCPNTRLGDPDKPTATLTYSGACKAMLTDGQGAIIDVSDTIYIDGVVVLGDRVVFRAPNIILGPHGRIMGQGQDAMKNAGGDNSGYGGLGAHGGGQASNYHRFCQPGAPWLHNVSGSLPSCATPIQANSYYDNEPSSVFYEPLSTASGIVNPYFAGIKGGEGSHGGQAEERESTTEYGDAMPAEDGMGGSGGSGGNNDGSGDVDHGSGGGGGGGYGIAFVTDSYSSDTASVIDVSGGNGGWPSLDDPTNGGNGGAGGGGVVVIEAGSIVNHGNIDIEGGSGVYTWKTQVSTAVSTLSGGNGQVVIRNVSSSSPSVKKTLSPIKKNNGTQCNAPYTGAGCFNPYSLNKADQIQVMLELSNLPAGGASVQDEVFRSTSPPLTCVPDSGSISSSGTYNSSDYSVNWSGVTSANSILSYSCTVQ